MSAMASVFRALRHPLRTYNDVAKKAPFYTGVVTTGLKTSAADFFAQKVMERKEEMDWKRHTMFLAFGFGYLGIVQYWLYNNVFTMLCAPITRVVGHVGVAPVKTLIDQCIHHPLGYFPVFYLLKGVIEERPLAVTWERYKSELWPNLKACWMVWMPAQLVNFAFVPHHLRIPFVAGVSFVWTTIISLMRGAADDPQIQRSEDPVHQPLPSFGAVTHSSVPGAMTLPTVEHMMEHAPAAVEAIMDAVHEALPPSLGGSDHEESSTEEETGSSAEEDKHSSAGEEQKSSTKACT